jgi:K+/H+ antiporter YhaU regulatory subunit KhtT
MASYSEKNQNASPKAKKFSGKAATYLNYDRSVHTIGVNRMEIHQVWQAQVREYISKEGDKELKDYIFGKSDTNPLEEISKIKNEKLEEQDHKLEKLVETVRKFENKS